MSIIQNDVAACGNSVSIGGSVLAGLLKRHRQAQESRQFGASLIEALLFLLIVAIIAIGIFALFSNSWSSSKVQTETGYLQSIVSATQQFYATNRDYGNADITSALITTKAAPAPTIVGNTLRNSWGGTITVVGNGDTFTVATTNIPAKECIQLSQISINPISVSINGGGQTLPLTAAAAASACSSTTNTISWNIR
ncbi:type 4 pilus major pilin [Novosphingobium terrae]|uniref:type 4 pilus major pilin n=1 Tax=Novosphingobium terrae TaxID=2726189 RepID=UPI00197FBEAF|nr:type 4 pilus major pilin [Novosphingobium terrae]